MSKLGRVGTVNQEFLKVIQPELNSWGLFPHPNPNSSFGRGEHGYCYDFADLTDRSNIKLAVFDIIQPKPGLFVGGYNLGKLVGSEKELPILYGNMKGVFRLTRSWSIWNPINIRFELKQRESEPIAESASRLISDVFDELPKLKRYLYG